MRGAGGPLGVSVVESDDELVQGILASAQAVGWERVADANASDGERIGFTPSTITHGRRNSGYSAFVHPIRDPQTSLWRQVPVRADSYSTVTVRSACAPRRGRRRSITAPARR